MNHSGDVLIAEHLPATLDSVEPGRRVPPPEHKPSSSVALAPIPKPPVVAAPERDHILLGPLLRKARRRVGLSIESACRMAWISERELAQFEAGFREPASNVLERLCEIYEVDAARFSPGASCAKSSAERSASLDTLWLGWAKLDLAASDGSNHVLLRAVAQTLRALRSLDDHQAITVRDDELGTIAGVLDLHNEALLADLCHWLSLDEAAGLELIARLDHAAASVKQLTTGSSV